MTIETEVNGDSKSSNERGPSLVNRWACHARTIDFCSALAAEVGPEYKIFFPHRTLFHFFCPHRPASWTGSRAGSPVSLYVSLVLTLLAISQTAGNDVKIGLYSKAKNKLIENVVLIRSKLVTQFYR